MEIIRQSQVKSNKGMGHTSKNRAPAAGQFSCADPVMIAVYTPAPVYSAPALETAEYGWALGE